MLPEWWTKSYGEKPYAIINCIDGMKRIPDNSVDLVLTDPPYGINLEYGLYKDTKQNLLDMIMPMINEIKRISKFAMIFCGYNNLFDYPKPDYVFCWYYHPGHTYCSHGFNSWQPILVYGADPFMHKGLGCRDDVIISRMSENETDHPCEKSSDIFAKCILRGTTNKHDIVFDPFLGSGTTLLAGRMTERVALGFELDPQYEDTIKERMMEKILRIEEYGGE